MIRELDKKEYNTVLDMAKQINAHFDVDFIGPKESIIVYENKNCVIGFLQYLKLYDTLEIINIFVKEEYRNMGFAKDMLAFAVELDDSKNIFLEVDIDNIPLAIVKFLTPSIDKQIFINNNIKNMYVRYFLIIPFSSNS